MPVDESVNIDLNATDLNLDELDRKASKALKALEKEQKALGKSIKEAAKSERERKRLDERGGIFKERDDILPAGLGAPKDIRKKSRTLDEIIDEKVKKKAEKEIDKVFGDFKKNIFGDEVGADTVKNFVSFGKNPINFTKNILKSIPFLGGIVAFAEFTKSILDEIKKLDDFFKKFIDDRIKRDNELRSLQQQASIQAGDIQFILSTQAGAMQPRVPYNTYNEFNENRIKHTSDFALFDNSGGT